MERLVFLILFFLPIELFSQINLKGIVLDSFTKTGIKAKVILTDDSTIIDSMQTRIVRNNANFRFSIPAKKHTYWIKASAEGYLDTTICYEIRHIARNTSFTIPTIFMKKDFDSDTYKCVDLNGVVVKGTQVKFAYRGDTLVYNASAFKIHSGSMLNDLVKQLPGAELKSNGNIYVNGRKVDYLTLNGRDFFKGKNRIVLDNLPYYTVKELKLFETENEESRWLGFSDSRKDYVMDVVLKQEYVTGIVANLTMGVGTEQRYLGRAFGMRNTHHSSLSIYGNLDNANATSVNDTDWKTNSEGGVLTETRQAGMNLTIQDKNRRWTEKLTANSGWKKDFVEDEQLRREYTTEKEITQTSTSSNTSRSKFFDISNNFTLAKPYRIRTNVRLSYSKKDDNGYYHNLSLQNKENRDYSKVNGDFNVSGLVDYMTKLATGDDLSLQIDAKYGNRTPNRHNSNDSINYSLLDSVYTRNTENQNNSSNYDYSITGHYIMHFLNHINIFGKVIYSQQYNHTNNLYSYNGLFDGFNSYSYNNLLRKYSALCGIGYLRESATGIINLTLTLPFHYIDEGINYHSIQLMKTTRRNYTNFLPNLYVEVTRNGYIVNGSANVVVVPPNIVEIVPTVNTFDPLHLYKNNPFLRNSVMYKANVLVGRNNRNTGQFYSLGVHANTTHDAIGHKITYSTQTGQYSYQNDNVSSANYDLGAIIHYRFDWGKNKAFSSEFKTQFDLIHNVDYEIGYDVATNMLSNVDTKLSKTSFNTKYNYRNFSSTFGGDFLWRNSESNRTGFEEINALEFNYGATTVLNIPSVDVCISTDFHVYCRRGYDMQGMNSDDCVLNASLNYGIIKNKLSCKITGYDLLHQLSTKKMIIDAQGYTETIHRACIPNYLMLSLTYFVR